VMQGDQMPGDMTPAQATGLGMSERQRHFEPTQPERCDPR
jgi:hypothetical protein